MSKGESPDGVIDTREYHGENGDCHIIGVVHDSADVEFNSYIKNIVENMDNVAMCVEAPQKKIVVSEQKIAKEYCMSNEIDIFAIDTLPSRYEGGIEYMLYINEILEEYNFYNHHAESEHGRQSILSKNEVEDPEVREWLSERDQMMSVQIMRKLQKEKYDSVIAIVGILHLDGVFYSLNTLEKKYNFS